MEYYNMPIYNRLDPAIEAENMRSQREWDRKREEERRSLENAVDRLEEDLDEIRKSEEILRSRLRALERAPRHLWVAFVALLYLVIGGIIIPSLLMPAGPERLSNGVKTLIIVLFVTGIASVFLYVIYLTYAPSIDRWLSKWRTRVLGSRTHTAGNSSVDHLSEESSSKDPQSE